MRIKDLDKYLNKADNISDGIDHLRLNLKETIPFLSEVLHKLDSDNSNQEIKQIEGYSLAMSKFRTPNGSALNISISIDDVPYTIWQYLEYDSKNSILLKSNGSFTYYSTFFRLTEMGLIESSFDKIIFKKEMFFLYQATISRMDYRIDFFYKQKTNIIPMKDIVTYKSNYKSNRYFLDKETYDNHQDLLLRRMNQGKSINYDAKTFYSKGDFQNSRSIGNKKNRSIFIRCYEKLIDSMSKGKTMLYDDYFIYPNVFRLEIEFLAKFNKKENGNFFVYAEISDLEKKVHRFLEISNSIGDEKFLYQYKKNTQTDFLDIDHYQKNFGGRGYSLYLKGVNPFVSLYNVLKKKLNDGILSRMIETFLNSIKKTDEKK